MTKIKNYTYLKDVELIFRNFSGKELKFNKSGDRNFCIALTAEQAEELEALGYNIKMIASREQPYIMVAVSFEHKPPKITQATSRGTVLLSEDMIGLLDGADIEYTDVVISPYNWEVNGDTGIKAYLKSMYVELYEDEIDIMLAKKAAEE